MTVSVPEIKKEKAKVVDSKRGLLLVLFYAVLCAEIMLMVFCLTKVPDLATMVYNYVTLPEVFHFVTAFKWLFQALLFLLACVPGALLILLTEIVMSKIANK